MNRDKIKIISTLGPSTHGEHDLRMLKDRGVDFVRVNMSHSTIEDLRYFVGLAKKVDIPFIIDTEGSQIRSGDLNADRIYFEEGDELKILADNIIGDKEKVCLKPRCAVEQLEEGDILRIDFDTLMVRISDTSNIKSGYAIAKVITAGYLGKNKAVIIDSGCPKVYNLPCLSEKDYQSITIGLEEGVGYIAASFIRSGDYVDEVRVATQGRMKIISKIECVDALTHLDEIMEKSDYLLIDRGDLSKEVPIEKIPLLQMILIQKARKFNKGVFVATNLLETMVKSSKPTRAEIHDIAQTVMDGAYGLTLSAETAIGEHPIGCVNMLNRIISHTTANIDLEQSAKKDIKLVGQMEIKDYLTKVNEPSLLISPHGGVLVDRILRPIPNLEYLNALPRLRLNMNQLMDVEQIAIGTFSPLEGFMDKKDLNNVLDNMRLKSGVIWPLPVVLDVSREAAVLLKEGQAIALMDGEEMIAILHLAEKYSVDKKEMSEKLYGTISEEHPGVRMVNNLGEIFLAGKIDLLRRRRSPYRQYELTPLQVRRLFAERGWTKIVGFHTRNVIHRSHEFIQLKAMRDYYCDGLFVHPIIGKKKKGDYQADFIIKSYELMTKNFYPKNKVVFATFCTFSRYAGPREALFTAICRKNFGCSHFIVGRDHTGVGNFYSPTASHDIFDHFPDLGIIPIKFGNVFYSKRLEEHVEETTTDNHAAEEKLHISGTQARKLFESGERPPEWFMRVEISEMIIEALNKGEDVFVK